MVFYNGIILVEKSNEKKKETKENEKKVGLPSAPGLALGKLPSPSPTHSILGFRKRRI